MSGMNSNLRTTASTDSSHSLLTAIHRFVQAVDTMDDTVMIPCRLRDIPVDGINLSEENNNTTTTKAVVPAVPVSGDLYHFYSMLQAIRKEIVAGPSSEEDDDDSCLSCETDSSDDNGNNESENAKKTATAFRYHLRGLFGLLHQMTETAKYLSSRYETEISPSQNGVTSVSSFNM